MIIQVLGPFFKCYTKTMYLSERWKSIRFSVKSGKLKFWILCSIFYCLTFVPIFGFNIDIKNPLVFNGTQAGSHFGYSVAFIKTSNGIRLMVAAPKFGSGDNSPGKLYDCQLPGKVPLGRYEQCDSTVEISDETSLPNTQAYDYQQWLGVAMDVDEVSGKFIVCAHRWCEIVSKQLRMVGACYLFKSLNDYRIWAPLLDSPKKNGVFYQGMAQFGTSAQFSKNTKDILFGAPGIYQGRGGFVIKDISSNNYTTVDYSNTEKHKVYSNEEYEDSMVGYSITSGKFFFNKVQIAVGGPGPSTFGLGKVLIYSNDMLIGYYSGSQFGGGFGSSLASGDFSGNGHDDLVVGAPMEYDVVNEGRVYILISTGQGAFHQNKIVLMGDNIRGAQFGTTVANIGDLNKDGLDDLAVGAPFEDECGAVYIYYASSISIDEKRRQKILGKTISPDLRGFGISFTRPKDVDNNGYLDFAVGAFLSDQAVLLHTRPVIKINTTIKSSPMEFDPQSADCFGDLFKSGCLSLTVSISLVGKAFKEVDLDVQIVVDVEKSENQKRSDLENAKDKHIRTKLGLKNKFQKTYELKTKKTKDLFKPVVIDLKVSVLSESKKESISPVQDFLEPNTIKYEIPFLNDCGMDKLCAVDLQTGLKYLGIEKNNVFLIDGERQFKVGVTIGNGAEPAYQPLGTLVYPNFINYVSYHQSENNKVLGCHLVTTGNSSQSDAENSVICSFNNPLRRGLLLYYELIFEIPQAFQEVDQFKMKFEVTSEGSEMYPESNKATLGIKMRKKSVISVNTVSDPQYLLVSQKKETKSSNYIKDISHQYGLYNNGPSDLKSGSFVLKIHKSKPLLSDLISQVNGTETSPIITCLTEKFNETTEFYERKCVFEKWLKESLFSVEVYMKVDVSKLESPLPIIKSELIMDSVKDSDYVNDIAIEHKVFSVSTILRSPGQPKPVQMWIIVVCIILGILLLLGFIAGLWKFSCQPQTTSKQSEANSPLSVLNKKKRTRCKSCGFFKREKVHHIRQHEGSMKQEVQPDPDSVPLNGNESQNES